MSTNHNDVPRTDVQFSIFLVNKPGVLARVLQHLAERKINVTALSIMESTEHGVLRVVVEDAEKARKAVRELDMHVTEQQVLTATLPNRPGAMSDVVARLAADHINVHYAYCTTGGAGNKTLGILKVSDQAKAVKVLTERKPQRRLDNSPIKRGVAKRK